jgi:hypothetical protein
MVMDFKFTSQNNTIRIGIYADDVKILSIDTTWDEYKDVYILHKWSNYGLYRDDIEFIDGVIITDGVDKI